MKAEEGCTMNCKETLKAILGFDHFKSMQEPVVKQNLRPPERVFLQEGCRVDGSSSGNGARPGRSIFRGRVEVPGY